MKNFQFQIELGQRDEVKRILEQSNDVIIDNVTDEIISFTIELDEDASDKLYNELRAEVELRVYSTRRVVL